MCVRTTNIRSNFLDVEEAKQFHTAVPSLEKCRWTQVSEVKANQRYNCGIVCLKRFDILVPGANLSVNVASANYSSILTITCHMI